MKNTIHTDRSGRTANVSQTVEENAIGHGLDAHEATSDADGKGKLASNKGLASLRISMVHRPKEAKQNEGEGNTSNSQVQQGQAATSRWLVVHSEAWEDLEGMDIRVVSAPRGRVEK